MKNHATFTLSACWAIQATLNTLYGISRQTRAERISGVYEHRTLRPHALLTRGFDGSFLAPHSRYIDFPAGLTRDYTGLETLVEMEEGDAYLFVSKNKRIAPVTGHPGYDVNTLTSEYFRDVGVGLSLEVPYSYSPQSDPQNKPRTTRRSYGNLLPVNWLSYCVCQITPYDLCHTNPTSE